MKKVRLECREFPRLTVPIPAEFRLRGSKVLRHGVIENLSRSGVAILTPVPLPRHDFIAELSLALPSENGNKSRRIDAAAGIVTSEKRLFSDSSERYRSGLLFLDSKNELSEEIGRFIEEERTRTMKEKPFLARTA